MSKSSQIQAHVRTFSCGFILAIAIVLIPSKDSKPAVQLQKPTITETVPATVDKPKMSTEIDAVYERLVSCKEVSFMELDKMSHSKQLEVISSVKTAFAAEILKLEQMLDNSTALKKSIYESTLARMRAISLDLRIYEAYLKELTKKA